MESNSIEQDVHDFLKSNGYRYYPGRFEWPLAEKALYQKRVENESVCETNDGLFINVHLVRYMDSSNRSFEIEITAEKTELWWKMMAYSLSENELFERLSEIENTLTKMFNSIAVK